MQRLKLAKLQKRLPFSSPFCSVPASNYLYHRLGFFLSKQTSTLKSVLQSHSLVVTSGNANNFFFAAKLIFLYAALSRTDSSSLLFHSVHPKDAFLWNSIIQSHFSNGNYPHAFDFYLQMRASGTLPGQFTLPMVVSTCAELSFLRHGMTIHGLVLKLGLLVGNSAVGSSFVYMYSKCGVMEDAYLMFDEMLFRDVVAWTALIVGCVQNGESDNGLKYLREMHSIGRDCVAPNFRTLEVGLQACSNLGALETGRCLHGLVSKVGIISFPDVQSSLFSLYSKCGEPSDTYLSFRELSNRDLFSWTQVIATHAKLGFMNECMSLFCEMLDSQTLPDEILINCMLLGFGNSVSVFQGKAFHCFILRRHQVFNQTVQNTLLSMYCKFGLLTTAEKLFYSLCERTKEEWNAIILGYGNSGEAAKCIELFREMQHLGIESDSNTLASVVSSCSQLGAIDLGRSLHCCMIKSSMIDIVSVANSLIDMYGRSGNLTTAWRIFWRIERDIISWNTLISSYSRSGRFSEAIAFYDQMISEGLTPNPVTCVTVLSACAHLASLQKGESIHRYIKENELEVNSSLGTALVDMYAKCGRLEIARELFNSMEERDVVCWNVMITGYGMHGHVRSAIEVFQLMEKSNIKPNELTFLAILSACSHSGLVEEGKQLFHRMHKYSLTPNLKHYSCMVNLLGRAGELEEAEALILSMPISPDGAVWGSLLSACKLQNETEMGVRIAKRAIESDPENDGYYILLCAMYDSLGRWEEAENVRNMMKLRRVEKIAGWSAV